MDLDASTWHGAPYSTLHGLGWLVFAIIVLRPGAHVDGESAVRPVPVAGLRFGDAR
jgi:hypothetical protein